MPITDKLSISGVKYAENPQIFIWAKNDDLQTPQRCLP